MFPFDDVIMRPNANEATMNNIRANESYESKRTDDIYPWTTQNKPMGIFQICCKQSGGETNPRVCGDTPYKSWCHIPWVSDFRWPDRLLHSLGLVAVGLSVGYESITAYLIGWSKYILREVCPAVDFRNNAKHCELMWPVGILIVFRKLLAVLCIEKWPAVRTV